MKILYLDIFSGISGDMFNGAMIDLGVSPDRLQTELRKLRLEGFHLHVTRATKANIEGVKFDVHIEGTGEAASRIHSHTHTHHHDNLSHVHEHTHSHAHGGDQERHDAQDGHLTGRTHGPHSGPLVDTPRGRVELSVFETGVPPRFRVYFFDGQGHPIRPPAAKAVTIETIRARRRRQLFKFKAESEYLEATTELPEPHQFRAVLLIRRGTRTERHETEFVEEHHSHAHQDPHKGSRNFAEIRNLLQQSTLSDWVKQKGVAIFHRIAEAEGKIHGHPPEEVHFHEVGAIDSIVDIVGACLALELLDKPRVLAANVVEGTGWVQCAHGHFPVPTMATLAILGARGIAVTQCEEPHELVTPTGAALLAEFVEEFGPMKNLVAEKIGYGLGTRDNQTRPNILRAVLGEVSATAPAVASRNDWLADTIAVLETNLDDCTAEVMGYVVERALAEGALDVFHTPVQMKKNRPGVLLTILCEAQHADKFSEVLLRETSAFGVRRYSAERRKLRRELITVKTAFGEVTVKLGTLNGKVVQVAPEFESCRKLAQERHVSLSEIYEAAQHALPKY